MCELCDKLNEKQEIEYGRMMKRAQRKINKNLHKSVEEKIKNEVLEEKWKNVN